ncbi:MAG TPA: tRNA lysidine(34) synthetase TilS [Flavobacteriales bacterium]|nr:tRNA lysidine(34) synthetase TilS [Flavobacteriales bacterium]HRE73876.1 tRNA lysidine(34) synthetase TilS [Flavobacteriales bacterium]HRE98129.1 tRNA lysidine(34) synthetase TilS [Flavobacteriales bacterium]HRJ35055.1 tRNA lysidine(34) synthetase TilS [Flavobacteriales bacterium]HRJ39728.1 tRNA lysidine(34) synthetase TilS [Flavobacteriales bacterium]
MHTLEKAFRKVIDEALPHLEEQHFLLAVSGGVDSVVLADLFFRSRLNFTIVHCNFQLRGEESERDESFVKQLASRYDVECLVRSFDTLSYAGTNHLSIQMAARELRYDWFRELMRTQRYSQLVTAHHRNDQAETFFINLLRGSGIEGLSGMRILEGTLFRPLLPFHRREIEGFANDTRLKWVEDSSNTSSDYLRNRIRMELIPVAEDIRSGAVEQIGEAMDRLADVNAYYKLHMEDERRRILQKNEFGYEFVMEDVMKSPVPRLMLFELMRGFGFRYPVIRQLLDHHQNNSGKKFFSSTHRAVLSRGVVVVTRITPEDLQIYEIVEGADNLQEPIRLTIRRKKYTGEIPTSPFHVVLDASRIEFPLALRRWHKGDSFIPLGMKGRKKLSDFFIDLKLSLVEKEQAWVLCSGDQLLWVVGHRIDERYKAHPETVEVLEISVEI